MFNYNGKKIIKDNLKKSKGKKLGDSYNKKLLFIIIYLLVLLYVSFIFVTVESMQMTSTNYDFLNISNTQG